MLLERSNDQPSTEVSQVSWLDELAYGICAQAVALARAQVSAGQADASLAELIEAPDFAAYFIRGLALGFAQTLAAHDQRVQVVYVSECALDRPERYAQSGALAHLLVLVTAPSAALEALISSLNRGLAASLSALPRPWGTRTDLPLDISLVTEQEVRQGAGVARLLSAVRPPPAKLWQRQI